MSDQRKYTYFLSDLHLGASYITDSRAHERRIVAWLRSIVSEAREIYLLGDVLDYWYEYREVVPKGYVRFFGALADLTDSGVKVTWLKGNHDIWIFDYIPTELGVEVVDGLCERTIDGHRFVMEHGDGVGEMDTSFRMLRSTFRNSTCQKLFSGIHPRWTIPFAHRWSAHSRMNGTEPTESHLDENDPLVRFCIDYNLAHPQHRAEYFLFGHRHLLIDQPLADGARMVVLGDCFRQFSFARFDGSRLTLGYMPTI